MIISIICMEKMNNLKYLYILTSDINDLYLEQTLLSISSLRKHTKNSFISILTDNITFETIQNDCNRNNFLKLVDDLKIVNTPLDKSKKYRSRWLKTSMRKHVNGDFLFLDSDTVIASNLKFNKNLNLAAVLDIHTTLNYRFKNLNYRNFHTTRDKQCGFITASEKYFNSGVIFCRDIPENHIFFEHWHKFWQHGTEKDVIEDQPSFSMANLSLGNIISELDGTWNCQLVRHGLFYLPNAKIIHYYNSVNNEKRYLFSRKQLHENIKKNGNIPLNIKKFINHPRSAFLLRSNRNDYDFINQIFFFILIIITSHPINYIFQILNSLKKNKHFHYL